jgi:hypothetical protein
LTYKGNSYTLFSHRFIVASHNEANSETEEGLSGHPALVVPVSGQGGGILFPERGLTMSTAQTAKGNVRKSQRTAGEQLLLALYALEGAVRRLEREHGAGCRCDACWPLPFLPRACALGNLAEILEGAGIESVPETLERNLHAAQKAGHTLGVSLWSERLAEATGR